MTTEPTPSELNVLRLEIRAGFAEIRASVAEVRTDLAALRQDLRDLWTEHMAHSHPDERGGP